MTPTEFIKTQPENRQALMTALHEAIMANDKSITPVVKSMMGKEMILYEERGYMKYGLASTQKHMSLHCLPMYMDPALHQQFEKLLPAAKFQKGCVNFMDETEMPPQTAVTLISDCAGISIADMLENRKKK